MHVERDAIGGRARKRTVAWGERKRDAGEHKRSAEKNGTADCDIRGGASRDETRENVDETRTRECELRRPTTNKRSCRSRDRRRNKHPPSPSIIEK